MRCNLGIERSKRAADRVLTSAEDTVCSGFLAPPRQNPELFQK